MLRLMILFLSLVLGAGAAQAQSAGTNYCDPRNPGMQIGCVPRPAPPPPVAPPTVTRTSPADIERAAYNACANARTTGPCEAYLRQYPNGSYAQTAKTRIADIKAAEAESRARTEAQRAAAEAERQRDRQPKTDPEPKLWAACDASTTTAPCERYLVEAPGGPKTAEARARIATLKAAAQERTDYDQCLASTAPGRCESFLATYQNSPLAAGAKAQIATIARLANDRAVAEKALAEQRAAAEREATAQREAALKSQAAAEQDKTAFAACRDGTGTADCQAYLVAAPTGAFRAQAQAKIDTINAANKEKAAFEQCRNGTTGDPCRDFVRAFPTSASAAEAARIAGTREAAAGAAAAEAAAWSRCEPGQSTLECEKYLALYPAGPHAQAAQTIIARIKDIEAKTRADAQEQAAWDQCKDERSLVLPCQKYLDSYKGGRFESLARDQIVMISTGPTADQPVPPLGLIVKRNAKRQLEVVTVSGNSSALGYVFGGDIITTINNKPYDPQIDPKDALNAAIAEDNGRVEVLIMRGAVPVSKVLRARR